MRFVTLLCLLMTGCSALQYKGFSPSVRSFHDEPRSGNYYIGADFQFIVLDEQAERKATATGNPVAVPEPAVPEDQQAVRPLPEPAIPY